MRERMKRFLLNCIRPLRRHDWQVDREWIEKNGKNFFDRMKRFYTRQTCTKCGLHTEPFPLDDRETFSRYHNATGCRGYKV